MSVRTARHDHAGDGGTRAGVLVAIPTYRRARSLEQLLGVLRGQTQTVGARVLVIDNDTEGTARDIAAAHGVDYVIEPERGLAGVRNRALDEAAGAGAIVFIDDDEMPADDWLTILVGRWVDSGAAAISGRVETRFPDGWSDAWIEYGGFFRRVRFDAGAHQPAAATNNLLIDLSVVRTHGLRFDPAFGLSGGEDILFTKQLVANGEIIVSCPEAVVFDIVDPDRLNRRWVLRRAYRVGVSAVRTEMAVRPHRRALIRINGLMGGIARMTVGGLRWVVGELVRSPRHSARGARATWRGAGMAMAAVGADYQEYARR